MPITLSCPCGKSLRVADEHAGKKVRCPACGNINSAPAADAEPQFEVVNDAPARAAKPVARPKPEVEEDEEEGGSYGMAPAEKTAPVPRPTPNFRKRAGDPDADEADRELDDRRREASVPRSGRAAREHAKFQARQVGHIFGGIAMLLGGGALGLFGNSDTTRLTAKGWALCVCLVLGGLYVLAQGLTGNFDDDD